MPPDGPTTVHSLAISDRLTIQAAAALTPDRVLALLESGPGGLTTIDVAERTAIPGSDSRFSSSQRWDCATTGRSARAGSALQANNA